MVKLTNDQKDEIIVLKLKGTKAKEIMENIPFQDLTYINY